MFSHFVKGKIAILAVFLCLAATATVAARGRVERESRARLDQVEQLIDEKRYNEAILLLSQVVKENPDRFDAAEKLMEQIRARRAEIDQSFAELNEAVRDGESEQIILDRIVSLNELNPYPSESEKALIEELLETGIWAIAKQERFEEEMARARAQIEAGEFRQAVSIYLEAFLIAKDGFDEAKHGNIVMNSVETALDDVRQAIEGHDTVSASLTSAAQGFGEDPGSLPTEVAAAAAALQAMAEFVVPVERSGTIFDDQEQRIKESLSDNKSILFLAHANQIVFGRKIPNTEERGAEGIAYALDSIWRRELDSLESRLRRPGEAAYTAAVEQFRRRSLDAALTSIGQAQALFPSLMDLQALWPLRIEPTRPYPTGEAGRSAFTAALPGLLRTQEYLKALEVYRALIQTNRRVAVLTEKELTSAQQIYDDREELETLLQGTTELDSTWSDQLQSYRQGAGLGLSLTRHVSQAGEVLSDIGVIREGINDLDARLLYRLTLLQGAEFEELFRIYEVQFDQAVKLQDGTEVTLETTTRIEKYPAGARDIYLSLKDNLEDLDQGVGTLLTEVLVKADEDPRNIEIQNAIASLQSLDERIANRQAELEPRLEDAQQAALQAERYKQEGLQRYLDAQTNVRNGRYDSARQNIEISTEALDTSLSFQEDEEVRRIRSEDLIALAERIRRELTEKVIVEVRRLIEEGRRRYAQGDFTGAEQKFRTAQDEWLNAFTTDNDEVNFWLELVRSAVDATTGRTIAQTDPLYKEMSQLYNLALGDFETGQQLVEEGRVGEAKEPLDRAESRLLKILFPFPFNAKARVLTLRILQIRDPEAFSARITELYNEAFRRRAESPQEAYASLKDIEQILPTYPGLQSAIANLEVALGFRIPPPDPAKIARSRDLYLEAKTVWERQQRFLFEDALNNLNEAISLDPDNRTAVVLKDQLLRAMGGGVTIVLSPEDQGLLQQAQQLYIERRYFEALLIVEQLLRKPTNQTNADILELEKRVRAKTGT